MMNSFKYRFKAVFLTALWTLVKPSHGDNSSCGGLITYNQYTDIFKSAPTCLQKGCGTGILTSMSSTCASTSACYPIWNILHEEYQQDWCSTCHEEDRACRIYGWPILNTTAACDMSPNTWLFNNRGCCTNGGDEMASLASWIQTLCNGTWRNQFKYYDGMALADWEQYILPDNHTVASANITQSHCTANKKKYLGILGAENVVVLLLIIFYFRFTLWISREDARDEPWIRRTKRILRPLTWIKRRLGAGLKTIFRIKSSGGGTWPVVKTILLAIFFSGIQLFFNFANAYVIKDSPGYENVDANLLALLFCTRPRLGWLACFLSIIPSTWIERYFDTQHSDVLAKGMMSVARVGISAAMGEVIMQLLGSYYLGKTVHIGTLRGFYKHNHLAPFWKGYQAKDMYNGALLWAIALPAVTSVWIAVIVLLGSVMIFFGLMSAGWKEVKKMAKKQKNKISKGGASPETRLFIPQSPTIQASQAPVLHQTRLYDPIRPASEPSSISILDNNGGAVTIEQAEAVQIPEWGAPRMATVPKYRDSISSSPLQQHPVLPGDIPTPDGPFADPNPSLSVSTPHEDPFADPTSSHLANIPPSTDISVRQPPPRASTSYHPINTRETYISQTGEEEDFPAQLRPGHRDSVTSPIFVDEFDTTSPTNDTPPRPFENPFADPINVRRRRAPTRPAFFSNNTEYRGVGGQDIEENHSLEQHEDEKPKPQPPAWAHTPRSLEEWKPFILGLGMFWGFVSYIAQWLFWSGFVNASDDRFCPPNTGVLGVVWIIAGILGFGSLFGLSYGGTS